MRYQASAAGHDGCVLALLSAQPPRLSEQMDEGAAPLSPQVKNIYSRIPAMK